MKPESEYIGCMLGAAIGDALGKQNEGLSREDILRTGYARNYGKACKGCIGNKLTPGQYTDDTEQMLVLAKSLIDCNGFNAEDFACRIARWGVEAFSDPLRKSLIGPASSSAIERLNAGISWKVSGSDIPSCGSAMRVAPIGLFYENLDEVESNAALSSLPTHRSKASIAGAVAVAIGVRYSLNNAECSEIMKEASARASKYDTNLGERIESSFQKRNYEPDRVFFELGTSYLVHETVPCAFYCFSKHFEDPEKALIEAVNAGGDTDSIACITGALCGALHGVHAFPEIWITGLENAEKVEKLALGIFKKFYERRSKRFIY